MLWVYDVTIAQGFWEEMILRFEMVPFWVQDQGILARHELWNTNDWHS